MELEYMDMSYNQIKQIPDKKLRSQYLKEYNFTLKRIVNKLYMGAVKYKDFKFSQNEEDMTLRQISAEVFDFLISKEMTKEQVAGLVTNPKK